MSENIYKNKSGAFFLLKKRDNLKDILFIKMYTVSSDMTENTSIPNKPKTKNPPLKNLKKITLDELSLW